MKLMSKIIGVFGLPCSGKTTLITALKESSRQLIVHVSTGDIARKLSTIEDIKYMADGGLFPHEGPLRAELLKLINARQMSGADYIILDGFPRFDDQLQWMIDNHLVGTSFDGCLIQVIGEDLEKRAKARSRDDQDAYDKILKKIKEQQQKIDGMEKLIQTIAIPYYTVNNNELFQATKTLAKYIGIRS